jgi:acyl-CoA dehydrogenase
MHLYVTVAQAYAWRNGAAGPAKLLQRVAEDGWIAMTSGGSDGIWPSAVAERVEGGYRLNGRKVFCSQAPVADLLTTMAAYDDPEEGRIVLMMGIPTSSDGFTVVETWDALGMRGTASHDVQLTNLFVSDAQVSARRSWGRNDRALRSALVHFVPTVASIYYGIAAGARDEAVRTVMQRRLPSGEPVAADPAVQRQVGLIEARLRVMWWALLGALDELGEGYAPDERASNVVTIAKREIVTGAIEVVDLAMDVVGGASYFKRSPLERAYRDVRAGKYHPFTPEKTLSHAGRLALDQPVDQIW